MRWALLLLIAGSAFAEAPVVRIRARARVVIDQVERTAEGAVVSGRLIDDALGSGIPDKPVRVLLRGPIDTVEALTATDPRGRFEAPMRAPLGRYEVQAAFPGDADYAAPAPGARTVDVARRPVQLALSGPERASRAGGPVPLRIEARDRGVPADLPVALLVDGRATAFAATGPAGRVQVALALPPEPRPGARVTIRARFAGDAVRDEATADHLLVVTAPSRIEAALEGRSAERGESIVVTGLLADPDGPLAAQPIEIVDGGGRAVGRAVTDGRGRFRAGCATGSLAVGTAHLAATYAPSVSWRDGARSPPLTLTVLPPRPIPIGGWLGPPLATAALVGLWWLARRRPWRHLRRYLRRRGARPADADFRGRTITASGLVAAKPRLRAALRRASDHGIDGVVWDATFGRPVAARVSALPSAGGGHTSTCDAAGQFSVEDLPIGPCAFTVVAPGYLAERFERDFPHRGELRGVRVNLVAVRAEIFDLWRRSAAPYVTETSTPREVADRAPDLSAFAALVEETNWSPRPADETHLAEAVRLAAALER